ncbi:MAG: hypothetical protein AABZ77_02315, partial [Chloroflexota bacterium]
MKVINVAVDEVRKAEAKQPRCILTMSHIFRWTQRAVGASQWGRRTWRGAARPVHVWGTSRRARRRRPLWLAPTLIQSGHVP